MEVNEGVEPAGASGTATGVEQGVRLRFVEILGLYRPGFSDRRQRGDHRPIRCGYQPGYTSHDDLGRIFINHRPRRSASENWQQARAKDTQYIEATVEVRDPSGVVPGNAKIRWGFGFPDDPDLGSMHSVAADYLRPSGGRFGVCDHPSPGAGNRPVFEALSGYPGAAVGAQMDTDIVGGRSGVRLHCTNFGGDRIRLVATLVNGPSPQPVVRTGHMTMWKRVDVEYRRMRGVRELPVDRIARAFELARIQLDITSSISMPHRRTVSTQASIHQEAADLARANFHHIHRPGWFLLIGADMDTTRSGSDQTRVVYPSGSGSGPGSMLSWNFAGAANNPHPVLSVPIALPPGQDASKVALYEGNNSLTFYADATHRNFRAGHPDTAITLRPLHYYPSPEAGDGSLAHALGGLQEYLPLRHGDIPGLGFERQVRCRVWTGRAIGSHGVTPVYPHRGGEYFGGRTVVCMGTFQNMDEAVQTAVHELCHAFGFPHACGRRAASSGAARACTMTILEDWVYRDGTEDLRRWYTPQRGLGFCERHLFGLREVHLEDNPYLWRWP